MSGLANSKTPIAQSAPSGQFMDIELDKRNFDVEVWKNGYKVFIDRAIKCPCTTKNAGQAQANCRNCGATGWVFLNRYDTRAVITEMNLDTKFKDWTTDKLGMASMTVLQRDHVSYMDRITIQEAETISSQVLYPETWGQQKVARLIYSDVTEIQEMWAFIGVDSPLLQLVEGTHYTRTDNQIFFIADLISQKDLTISCRYKHRPQYLVLDLMREMRHAPEKSPERDQGAFPMSAMIRRAHYVIDEQRLACKQLIDNSYTPTVTCEPPTPEC